MLPFTTDDLLVLPSTTTVDATTGNDTLTYPDLDDATPARGSLQPQGSTESLGGKDQVTSTYVGFFEAGVALKATDRVARVSGDDVLVLEVDGQPQRFPSPFGGEHHVEVQLTTVTG